MVNSNLVQQHVVQLQVSIDDAAIVQVEEADGDLGGVETGKKEEKEMSKPLCSFCVCMREGRDDWLPNAASGRSSEVSALYLRRLPFRTSAIFLDS